MQHCNPHCCLCSLWCQWSRAILHTSYHSRKLMRNTMAHGLQVVPTTARGPREADTEPGKIHSWKLWFSDCQHQQPWQPNHHGVPHCIHGTERGPSLLAEERRTSGLPRKPGCTQVCSLSNTPQHHAPALVHPHGGQARCTAPCMFSATLESFAAHPAGISTMEAGVILAMTAASFAVRFPCCQSLQCGRGIHEKNQQRGQRARHGHDA